MCWKLNCNLGLNSNPGLNVSFTQSFIMKFCFGSQAEKKTIQYRPRIQRITNDYTSHTGLSFKAAIGLADGIADLS